jgi:WD40 repeat protein
MRPASRGDESRRTTDPKRRDADPSEQQGIKNTWFGRLLNRGRALHLLIFSYLAAAGVVIKWFLKDFIAFEQEYPTAFWAIVIGPILFIMLFDMLPQFVTVRRQKRRAVIALEEVPVVSSEVYFRLDPYVGEDPAKFRREDGAHERVLNWIRATTRPVLFLSGASGAGKTSVLEAYVFPKLKEEGWRIVEVRGFPDPLTGLEQALGSPRRRGVRLLVVLDQFEEFIILEDQTDPERHRAFINRVRELRAENVPGIVLLFSFRTDYQSAVEGLDLDELSSRSNWTEVAPFDRGAAHRFIGSAPQRPSAELVDRLLNGADMLDETPRLYRPVVLNMLGLILKGFDRTFTGRPDRLIRGYLEAALMEKPIRDIAPSVVNEMITDGATKRAQDVMALAAATGLRVPDVTACLNRLAIKGLARHLGDTGGVWELSHDFVARQFAVLLGRMRPSVWRWLASFAAPVVFVFALAGAVFGIPLYLENQRKLDDADMKFLAELAGRERSSANLNSALRFAVRAARKNPNVGHATADAELAATVQQALWLYVLRGHGASVRSLAFSYDGSKVVTTSDDQTARIWDPRTGDQVAVLRGHQGPVYNAAFSSDGSRIVTASDDRTARIWDTATGKAIAVLTGHQDVVHSAAFSPDGSRIVTASDDHTARIWDTATGKETALLSAHLGEVNSAAFSRDGSRIVTASDDSTARIWDAGTGKEVGVLRGHQGLVYTAAFSPDGSRIVTAASEDNTARIWDAATGKEAAVLRGHQRGVHRAAFSPDGLRIVTVSLDQTARIWDVATRKEVAVLSGHQGLVYNAAFSPDGSRIVTASDDRTARIWDAATGKELVVLRGHERAVLDAAFSPDGSRVATVSDDQTARFWDPASEKEIAILHGHQDDINNASFSPDGSRIVTASDDSTARIWDAATRKEIAVLHGHDRALNSAAFSPDGLRIVTASNDQTAKIWDTVSGKEIAGLRGHENSVRSAAFSPDASRIVTASYDHTARIWDTVSSKEIAVLRGHENSVRSAAFSPDGSRIVTASDDSTARIWDAATGKGIAVLQGHDKALNSAAFSPDGLRIVTASGDQTARIWDAATGKEVAVLHGHQGSVNSAGFSPDGLRIVTASDDQTARIWDAATGKEVAVLHGHQGSVNSAAFSADGSHILTASEDKTARIWKENIATMSTEALVIEVCSRKLRGLTKFTRDEMRRAGYPDTTPEIDVCAGI